MTNVVIQVSPHGNDPLLFQRETKSGLWILSADAPSLLNSFTPLPSLVRRSGGQGNHLDNNTEVPR